MTPIDHFKQSARAALAIYSDTYFTRKGAGVGKAEALATLTAAAQELCLAELEAAITFQKGNHYDWLDFDEYLNDRIAAIRTTLTKENQQ